MNYNKLLDCMGHADDKAEISLKTASNDQIKRDYLQKVIIFRMIARELWYRLMESRSHLRAIQRDIEIMKRNGITFVLAEKLLEPKKEHEKIVENAVIRVGEMLMNLLDGWQSCGATLKDLCILCNRDYELVLKKIPEENKDELFSFLIFIYNLDYKDHRFEWIDDSVDAPLTHCIKEYMLYLMTKTSEGKAAAHEALTNVFPKLFEHACYISKDEYGEEHLYDGVGNDLGTVNKD